MKCPRFRLWGGEPTGHDRWLLPATKAVKGRVSGPEALPLTAAGAGRVLSDGAGRRVLGVDQDVIDHTGVLSWLTRLPEYLKFQIFLARL